MKKTIGNVALVDARKLTPEGAKAAPEIGNAALILVSEQSKELLTQLRIGNVASVVCLPEDTALHTINGKGTLGAGALLDKRIFILVNGKLGVDRDVTPEGIIKNVAGGVINGKLFCSASQLAALQGCGVLVNGKAEAYPDGCRLREGNRPITVAEANTLSKGERLYLGERALLEKGVLDRLIERDVRLCGAGFMLYESEAEKAGVCWQGDPSRIRVVKDGHRVLVGNQNINRRNALIFRGGMDVTGDVFIDSDVEASMLEALESIRIEGALWAPMALMQSMMEKVDGDVEWMPYEGALIRCEDRLALTNEMVANWTGRVTLYNNGVLEIAEDLEMEALKKHIALIHNAGVMMLTKAQRGALQTVVMGDGAIIEKENEKANEGAGESDEAETLGNAAWLVL